MIRLKKSELIEALAKETGLTKADVEKVFNGTFDFMNLGPSSDLFSKARLVSLAFFRSYSYFIMYLSKESL